MNNQGNKIIGMYGKKPNSVKTIQICAKYTKKNDGFCGIV